MPGVTLEGPIVAPRRQIFLPDPVVSLFKLTGTIIGSLHPKSANLMPVDPNPLDPCPVLSGSATILHSRFSMPFRMSCAMRSPVLI